MATRQQSQRLTEIAIRPTFRSIDGLSIGFVESAPASTDALILSPWPESIMCYATNLVATGSRSFART
jgi:hypothetical protein